MAKKRVNLGSKNFFTITVLSVAVLFTLFMANSFLQQQTSTQSEATGDNTGNLTNCNSNYDRSGGIKLFNDAKANIDDDTAYRIMCIPLKNQKTNIQFDPNLEKQDGNKYNDIWKFNDQTSSFTLRANKFCKIWVRFFAKPNYQNFMWESPLVGAWDRPVEKTFDIPQEYKKNASSLKLYSECDNTRYFIPPTPTPFM
jgi:hypothetical protein